jgi:hypothetical protein
MDGYNFVIENRKGLFYQRTSKNANPTSSIVPAGYTSVIILNMSRADEESAFGTCCASCGIAEDDDIIKLKTCTACGSILQR